MIPKNNLNDGLEFDFEIEESPSYTPRLNQDTYRISGFIDGLEAVKQAVYLILYVERYDWLIYSWNYGIELEHLYGKNTSFVIAELERTLTEAIMQDNRVNSVSDFKFNVSRNEIYVDFIVDTIYGEFQYNFKEVES